MIVKYPAFLGTEFRVVTVPWPLFNCFTKSKTLVFFNRELSFSTLAYFQLAYFQQHETTIMMSKRFWDTFPFFHASLCLEFACSQQYTFINTALPRLPPAWSNFKLRSMFIKGAIHSTKIQTGPTGKSGPTQKLDQFFRIFSGWTEPIHWVLDPTLSKRERKGGGGTSSPFGGGVVCSRLSDSRDDA